MRIGVNCYLLGADIGGMKQYFFNLFNELLTNDDENRYVFFHFHRNSEELARLKTTRWQENAILLESQEEAADHLDKIDLYFCPFSSLSPRPLPIPTVVFLHDIQEVFYPQFFSREILYGRAFHYIGSTKMADRVITNSEYSKQTIVERHRISPRKVGVAHLCADSRFHRAVDIATPPKAGAPDGDYIVYPANRWAHKNHDNLLRAMKWLKTERGLKINAVFTGYDMPDGCPIAEKASEYGLEDQVHTVGYVCVEELAFLYTRAKMLVFPSLFEGFGIPLVEAMASGCPVIASNVTSLPEIGGDVVEYFDPTDPESIGKTIEKTWFDGPGREKRIRGGLKRSRDFTAARLAKKHLALFSEAYETFSMRRYWWNKWVYRHYHRARTGLKHYKFTVPDFYNRLKQGAP